MRFNLARVGYRWGAPKMRATKAIELVHELSREIRAGDKRAKVYVYNSILDENMVVESVETDKDGNIVINAELERRWVGAE
jgi:hypothetical protein